MREEPVIDPRDKREIIGDAMEDQIREKLARDCMIWQAKLAVLHGLTSKTGYNLRTDLCSDVEALAALIVERHLEGK